jgi:hypothetical protein
MDREDVKIINKKPVFPVNRELKKYLFQYQREAITTCWNFASRFRLLINMVKIPYGNHLCIRII